MTTRADLERLNEHLRFAQQVACIGSWEFRIADNHRTWSDEMYAILGLDRADVPAEEESGALIQAVVHPDDRSMMEDVRRRIGNGEDVPEIEHRIVRPDGEVRHVRERVRMIRDDNGQPLRLFGTMEDVTDRVRTREELRRNEALLEIAGRMAKLGAWRWQVGEDEVTWSDEVAAIHELPATQRIALAEATDYIAPEWRERVADALAASVRDGTPFDEEFRIVTSKGKRVWVRAMGQVVRDASGRVQCVQGALQDISQSKAAEARVEELAGRLTTTLNSMSDAFATLDNDWRITFLNRQAERLLGKSADELLGKVVWDEFDEAIGTGFEREYRRAKAENRTINYEDYYAPLGLWVDVTIYPSPQGLGIYMRDVTARKQAEAAERESEKRFRIIAKATLDTVWDWNLRTDQVWWNDGMQTVFGYRLDDLEPDSRSWKTRIHPDDVERVLAEIHRVIDGQNGEWATEYRFRHRDGRYLVVADRGYVIRDDTGRAVRMVGGMNDITERREHEAKIAEQAALLDKAQEAILVRSLDDVITYWNKGAERFYGWTAEEAVGQRAQALLEVDIGDWNDMMKGLRDRGEWSGEVRKHRRNGEAVMVDSVWTAVRGEDGEPESILTIDTDITERLALEEQLRQSQRLESIGQLTGGVAHDFNNLLTVLLGNAELIADQVPSGSRLYKLAQMSRRAAQRGSELTHRLLAFARRQPLAPKVVDVNELVVGMENLLRSTLPEDIDIEVVPLEEAWRAVVDPAQLESVLLNLAINAKDAMPDGGQLTLETGNVHLDETYAANNVEVTPGHYVMIAVSDTGTGIPEEYMGRVFDPFFTTKETGKGTGLGLSMAYGFAKQSEGHIKIYSEPGQGTTVKVYLPKAERSTSTRPAAPRRPAAFDGSGKVLVVEDDELVREHAEHQLRDIGYEVLAASDGAAALDIIKDNDDIDLLFTDVIMPGRMNGRELAEAARRIRPKLKVLFTSGYTENAIMHHGRLDRGVHLLQKPYQRADLARKVREVLDGASPR